eukprot:1933667-Rhodomonas_salina.1
MLLLRVREAGNAVREHVWERESGAAVLRSQVQALSSEVLSSEVLRSKQCGQVRMVCGGGAGGLDASPPGRWADGLPELSQ